MKLVDLKPDDFRKLKFIGNPGAGKTIAMCSAPKPLYIFSFEGKLESALTYYKKRNPSVLEGIEFDEYNDVRPMQDKLEMWRNSCPYATIGFDSITSLADLAIRQTLRLNVVSKGGSDKGKRVGFTNVPGLEEYGAEDSILMDWILACKAIKANVIATAHYVADSIQAKPSQNVIQRVLLTGGRKIASKLPVYFNEIYNFKVESDLDITKPPRFVVLTKNDGIDYARTGLELPDKMDWTGSASFWEQLYSSIKG